MIARVYDSEPLKEFFQKDLSMWQSFGDGADIDILDRCKIKENYCLIVTVDGEAAGVFIVITDGDIHVAILPKYRGKTAIEMGKKVIAWVFENTDINTIIAPSYPHRKPAQRFARQCGMLYAGTVDGFTVYEVRK